jgi:AraC family transcriptional activator of mtrCDE
MQSDQMRMKRAADMLAARTFSVEQIARAVGYKSYSSFSIPKSRHV